MFQISNNNRLSELLNKEVLNYLFPGVAPEKMPTILIPQEPKVEEDYGVRFSARGKVDTQHLSDEYTAESVPQLFGGDFEDEIAAAPIQKKVKSPKPPKPKNSKTGFWTVIKNKASNKIDQLFDELEYDEAGDNTALDKADESRTNAILQRIRQIQEEFGISVEELGKMLEYEVHPSRIVITESQKILLTDFGNREVRMDPLSKAVFLLFLRHPEGIAYKDMPDHRSELLRLYGSISRMSDPEAIERSVDLLCNTVESNSLNEKVSKVKRAFINAVDERIAKYYIIDGSAGEARRISLPRNLVNWL